MAHELAHVLRLDNLRRALIESVLFLAPMAVWLLEAPQFVRATQASFFWLLAGGIATGLVLRLLVLPVVSYLQERRADERAARALGDRLLVASALVNVGRALGPLGLSLEPAFAISNFVVYRFPVSGRARRLMAEPARHVRLARRLLRPVLVPALLGAFVLLLMGAQRASAIYDEAGGWASLVPAGEVPVSPTSTAGEVQCEVSGDAASLMPVLASLAETLFENCEWGFACTEPTRETVHIFCSDPDMMSSLCSSSSASTQ